MNDCDCCQHCPEEDYSSRLLCRPLGIVLGWEDCDATKEVLAQARTGNAAAEFMMGAALETQGAPDIDRALMWYQRSARQGYQPAVERLTEISSCAKLSH